MGMILNISDFQVGRTKIALNPNQETDLGKYIDSVESFYLPQLFGKELYDLFVADWNSAPSGVPTAARFVVVYNAFTFQNDRLLIQSKGIKEMLKNIVYYEFVRDLVTRTSTTGIDKVIGENVDAVSAIQHDTTSRYNDATTDFRTIQYYMKTYDDLGYPEYNGVRLNYASIY